MIKDKLGTPLSLDDEVVAAYKNKLVKVTIIKFYKEYVILRHNGAGFSAKASNVIKV